MLDPHPNASLRAEGASSHAKAAVPSRVPIQIRETSSGGITLAGVMEAEVTSKEEMASYLTRGSLARATGSTNMNSQSRLFFPFSFFKHSMIKVVMHRTSHVIICLIVCLVKHYDTYYLMSFFNHPSWIHKQSKEIFHRCIPCETHKAPNMWCLIQPIPIVIHSLWLTFILYIGVDSLFLCYFWVLIGLLPSEWY